MTSSASNFFTVFMDMDMDYIDLIDFSIRQLMLAS